MKANGNLGIEYVLAVNVGTSVDVPTYTT